MKIVNKDIRAMYMMAIPFVTYMGQNIYLFEEFLQETSTRNIANITIGNMNMQAYILLLNQTLNDNSPKCMRSDECSIQIQIVTIFKRESGGSRFAEEIGELILNKIFPIDVVEPTLSLPEPLKLIRTQFETSVNIPLNTETDTRWITQLLLTHTVNQTQD